MFKLLEMQFFIVTYIINTVFNVNVCVRQNFGKHCVRRVEPHLTTTQTSINIWIMITIVVRPKKSYINKSVRLQLDNSPKLFNHCSMDSIHMSTELLWLV